MDTSIRDTRSIAHVSASAASESELIGVIGCRDVRKLMRGSLCVGDLLASAATCAFVIQRSLAHMYTHTNRHVTDAGDVTKLMQ